MTKQEAINQIRQLVREKLQPDFDAGHNIAELLLEQAERINEDDLVKALSIVIPEIIENRSVFRLAVACAYLAKKLKDKETAHSE